MGQEKYLKGRTAMVTGGASGMGRAIALALAEAGADVAIGSLLKDSASQASGELVYLPGVQELEGTRKEIETLGVRAIAPLPRCLLNAIRTSLLRCYSSSI